MTILALAIAGVKMRAFSPTQPPARSPISTGASWLSGVIASSDLSPVEGNTVTLTFEDTSIEGEIASSDLTPTEGQTVTLEFNQVANTYQWIDGDTGENLTGETAVEITWEASLVSSPPNIRVTNPTSGKSRVFRAPAHTVSPDVAPFLSDTFTDTDGTILPVHAGEVGAAWTTASGSPSVIINSGSQSGLGPSGGLSITHASGTPDDADYRVVAPFLVKTITSGSLGILVRSDATNGYLVLYDINNAKWSLYTQVASAFTEVAYFYQTLSAGSYNVVLDVRGSTIRVFVDGDIVIQYVDTQLASAGNVGTWTNGGPYSTTTGIWIDSIDGYNTNYELDTNYAFVLGGDSLQTDYGRLGTQTTMHQLSGLWNTARVWNVAVPADRIDQQIAIAEAQVHSRYADMVGYGRKLFIFEGGINDIAQGASAATVYSRLQTIHNDARAAGFETVGTTIQPADSVSGAEEIVRGDTNALILADNSFMDIFIDGTAITALQDTSSGIYYLADHVHRTVLGSLQWAQAIVAGVG